VAFYEIVPVHAYDPNISKLRNIKGWGPPMVRAKRKRKSACKNRAAVSTAAKASTGADIRIEPARRVLVAEDSPVTQDLLKLVLEQRGHSVDLVADGERALAALNEGQYDVALLDFHLPLMDGLEVASKFRANAPRTGGPRIVAITTDIKGLLGHSDNCENFDEIIPKPLDLEKILKVVERKSDEVYGDSEQKAPLAAVRQRRKPKGTSSGLLADKYEFLRWPDDFNADRLSARGMHASLADGTFDAILLNQKATTRDLSVIWTTKTLHLLPIIDMTGSLPKQVDLDGSKISLEETRDLDRLINSFRERREKLHHDLVYSDDIAEKLIGRLFVSGGKLEPRYDPTAKEYVCYNTMLDFRSIEKEIRDLLTQGFVERSFYDRFHMCGQCGSSHFNIREQCVECGSSHLSEEFYLHHFKCAYQGPESDFRMEDDLVCPKCRMELSHFSVDYDKPGSMMQCQDCSHATSEPNIGFVCMDCEAQYDGDTVRARDVYSYELTNQGSDFAIAGRALFDGKSATLRFTELPLELIVSMNAELKEYEADQTPFSLLNISYRNEREVDRTQGARMFEKSRDHILENLRNTARKKDLVIKGHNCDFMLLKATDPEEARAGLDELSAEATADLKIDTGMHVDVFGPEDFS
jgi:CheY-like chemotaxis protein